MKLSDLGKITLQKQKEMIRKISQQQKAKLKQVAGLEISCHPKVFSPHTDTVFLAKCVAIQGQETVLEPCTGSGFISVYLAKKAKLVHATDISPYAVANSKENATRNNVEEKMQVFCTNLFPETKILYDIIVINPPYTDEVSTEMEEKTVWDEENVVVKNFLTQAPQHLAPGGSIYLSWGNFADYRFIEGLLAEKKYEIQDIQEICEEKEPYICYRVYHVKHP